MALRCDICFEKDGDIVAVAAADGVVLVVTVGIVLLVAVVVGNS